MKYYFEIKDLICTYSYIFFLDNSCNTFPFNFRVDANGNAGNFLHKDQLRRFEEQTKSENEVITIIWRIKEKVAVIKPFHPILHKTLPRSPP